MTTRPLPQHDALRPACQLDGAERPQVPHESSLTVGLYTPLLRGLAVLRVGESRGRRRPSRTARPRVPPRSRVTSSRSTSRSRQRAPVWQVTATSAAPNSRASPPGYPKGPAMVSPACVTTAPVYPCLTSRDRGFRTDCPPWAPAPPVAREPEAVCASGLGGVGVLDDARRARRASQQLQLVDQLTGCRARQLRQLRRRKTAGASAPESTRRPRTSRHAAPARPPGAPGEPG